nr:DUF4421 family protein [uncultured Flavobacterium sp.]
MGIKYFIWVLLVSGCCFGQTDTLSSAWYKEFKDVLAVQAFTLNTQNTFTLNYTADDLIIDLKPDAKTTLGLAVQYDIISFSLGFSPKFFEDNRNRRGGKMTSFSFDMFPGRFMQHFDLYYQRGIVLDVRNSGDIFLPGLKTLKIGGSTSYFLNQNFSFRASSLQNAKQLKSAGSFAPTLSYYYTEFNSKHEPLINDDKVYYIDVALAPVYYYNWVIGKNFLVSSGASLGAGFTTTLDDNNSTTKFLINGSFHFAPGYSGERWFGGLNARVLLFNRATESNVEMGDAITYSTFFVGYRFDEPRILKKTRKRIERAINRASGKPEEL